mgnify:CR=1 FL=1
MEKIVQEKNLLTLVYNEILETIAKTEATWPQYSSTDIEGNLRLLAIEIADEHPEFNRMSSDEQDLFLDSIINELTGFGPISQYLEDDTITEIMVNGITNIFIERNGLISAVPDKFISKNQLMRIIKTITSPLGRRIDELNPMVDARLPDGSRVNVVIPPIAIDGPYLTIRKFGRKAFTLEELVSFGTLSQEIAQFLATAVSNKDSIIVSGGTGTGKTTLLNVLASRISDDERIITIEDAAELRITSDHVARLEARPPSPEGKGEVTIRHLVRNALRMRPDRIIIGEVRGAEALDLIQALNTGHRGSLSTVHAENPLQALYRLETMAMLAGYEIPLSVIRNQISGAVKYIVHLDRIRTGQRVVSSIVELVGCSKGEYVLKEHYKAKAVA